MILGFEFGRQNYMSTVALAHLLLCALNLSFSQVK
jgi:hypothetical protein